MYNEELKTRFIQEYTKSISRAEACVQAFNAIEPFEVQWDADFCTKSAAELEPVVEQLVGFRVRSRWLRIIIFQKYVKWCLAHKVKDACDGMLQVECAGLDKVRTQMVSNPTMLQAYLDVVCDPESEKTTDNIYRCFYWMAYSGMDEHDIMNVKCSDVDFNNMVIRYGGEEYEIHREAIPAFRNAATLTEFVYKHPNYPPDKKVIRNRALGDTLIRGIRSTTSLAALRVELSRRSKKFIEDGLTDKQLSYYRVYLSGLFYNMKKREEAGIPVDFTGVASRFMEGKTYKLDAGRNTPEAKKRAVVNDYLQDYERWKAAFNL
ncbi:MAG: hypothetical protein E7470_08725 [Ruminococcaceae bacterium]|nr:hypothetical protein [Oscillospiraceae bacterium]